MNYPTCTRCQWWTTLPVRDASDELPYLYEMPVMNSPSCARCQWWTSLRDDSDELPYLCKCQWWTTLPVRDASDELPYLSEMPVINYPIPVRDASKELPYLCEMPVMYYPTCTRCQWWTTLFCKRCQWWTTLFCTRCQWWITQPVGNSSDELTRCQWWTPAPVRDANGGQPWLSGRWHCCRLRRREWPSEAAGAPCRRETWGPLQGYTATEVRGHFYTRKKVSGG